MDSMCIIVYGALIYYRIKGSHDDEEEEEEDDVILSFEHSELSLSRSDAAGRAGQTIKATSHIKLFFFNKVVLHIMT